MKSLYLETKHNKSISTSYNYPISNKIMIPYKKRNMT